MIAYLLALLIDVAILGGALLMIPWGTATIRTAARSAGRHRAGLARRRGRHLGGKHRPATIRFALGATA